MRSQLSTDIPENNVPEKLCVGNIPHSLRDRNDDDDDDRNVID
jgi:hypothetical protein